MSHDLYQEIILEESKHPHNIGALPHPDAQHTEKTSCGDTVAVTIELSADKTVITNLLWEGEGCVISKAFSSALSQAVIGKKVTEVLSWELADVLKLLGLDEISPGRVHCVLISLYALRHALQK